VKKFQAAVGVSVDGIAGPVTRAAIQNRLPLRRNYHFHHRQRQPQQPRRRLHRHASSVDNAIATAFPVADGNAFTVASFYSGEN
jgi:hypothetical protein